MKKLLVLLMVVALAAAVTGVAGCGGNTSQAQTATKAADAAYKVVNADLDNLQTMLTPILGGALSGNFSALTPAALSSATALVNKILAEMPAVKAQYQKVAAMSGVPDYTAYANAMIKAIDANTKAITMLKGLMAALTPLVAAGNAAGITAYFTTNSAVINELQTLSTQASDAYNQAQSIKTSKNLK